jgi:prepilin-type N-terminal cleavage/methylation domain-containing protein
MVEMTRHSQPRNGFTLIELLVAMTIIALLLSGAVKRYQAKLEDLLTDSRYNPPQHYLRRLYRDPIMNQKRWGIITALGGGIMGVHSLSEQLPSKALISVMRIRGSRGRQSTRIGSLSIFLQF